MARADGRQLPDYENQDGRGNPNKPELTDRLSKYICALVAQGISIQRIVKRADSPPECPKHIETVLNWLTYGELKYAEGKRKSRFSVFAERYRRAVAVQALAGYNMLLDIEDRVLSEPKFLENPDYDKDEALQALRNGKDYPEPKYLHNQRYLETTAASCVMASIKWRLARLAPEKFGDKLEIYRHLTVEHTLKEDAPDFLQKLIAKQDRPELANAIDITPDAAPQLPAAKRTGTDG